MYNRKVSTPLLVLIVLLTAIGCASSDYSKKLKKSEEMFYYGKYKEAARTLLPAVNSRSKDQLLYMMECGLMLHAAGDYENSNKVLLKAADIADKITTSISKQTASLLLNERSTNYKGEDFERVLVHMYLGINFLMLEKPEEARVEFKRVNELLREINVRTARDYKQNIMAKYLTAIAFELIADKENDFNDREFAYIEYKQIYQLQPRLALVYRDLQRLAKKLDDDEDYSRWIRTFGKKDRIPADAGEIVVIFQAGRSAVKVSRGSLLSDPKMKSNIRVTLNGMSLKQGVTIAGVLVVLNNAENPIPKFKKRSNKIRYLVINVNGRNIDRTYMLENIEDTAVQNLKDDYKRMYSKVAAGIAVKAATAIAAGYAAKKLAEQSKQLGGFAGIIGTAVGVGTGAGLVSQIKPDLRCWHTLPANLQLGRVFLPEGEYDITIKLIDYNGKVDRTDKKKITVKKGEKAFMNYRTLY